MSGPSANGRAEPFDLQSAADAAAAEAEGRSFPFTFAGASYTVPPPTAWPISALRALGDGDLEAALTTLLGGDTFAELADAGLTIGGLNVLFERIAADSGMTLPNSPPPARRAGTRTSKRR